MLKALSPITAKLFEPIRFPTTDRLELSLTSDATKFTANFYSMSIIEGRRTYPSHTYKRLIERFPERKQVDGLCTWELAATDITAQLLELFPAEQMKVDGDAELVLQYLRATCKQQEINADIHARYKELKEVPKHAFAYNEEYPLKPYQQVAHCLTDKAEGFGLFMEQGTGKTPVAIATLCNKAHETYVKEKRMYRCIVVCPNSVRLNWFHEFCKFTTLPGNVTVLRGSQLNRTKLLVDAFTPDADSEFTVVIVSYESLSKTWDSLGMIQWDLAILDEGHAIKWPETLRFKYAMKLRDNSRQRIIATGTPIANTILDLYGLFEFMGKGFSGFNSWKNFRSFYGVYKPTNSGFEKLVGVQNLPFMKERLARNTFIITKKEALPELPETTSDIYEVEMTDEQADLYKQVSTQLMAEIENDLDESGNKTLTINNILTKLLRLSHITSGFVTWDAVYSPDGEVLRPKRLEGLKDNPKIAGVLDMLQAKTDPTEKTIIWAAWRYDIQAIKEACDSAGIKAVTFYGSTSESQREEAINAFNGDPETKVFIGNAGAGGAGLNLLGYPPGQGDKYETDATHVIYYSQDWSRIKRSQSKDRNHRMGTRRPVRYTDLCVPETIDEEIRARVTQKEMNALEISDLREILKSVLKGWDHE